MTPNEKCTVVKRFINKQYRSNRRSSFAHFIIQLFVAHAVKYHGMDTDW